MRGLLLDSHVPLAVVTGVRSIRPECRIEHLAHWQNGRFLHAADEQILRAAEPEGLVLVTHDTDTVPHTVHQLLTRGEPIAGAALIPVSLRGGTQVGAIVRVIVRFHDDPSVLNPDYPLAYLRAR